MIMSGPGGSEREDSEGASSIRIASQAIGETNSKQ